MKTIKTIVATLLLGAITVTANAQVETHTTNGSEHFTKTNGTGDDIENTGTVGISGWPSFNNLAVAMTELDGATYHNTKVIVNNMRGTVANLDDTRPDWMNTEEVNEDIADFQKDYNELITEDKMSEKEYRENLEEIAEQFEDLREEIDETFMEYVNINRSATEEYREEIKDGSKENRADAREEYNEEIKELEKVRDGKK